MYTLTNSLGCTAADSVQVEVWDIPTNTLTIQPAEGCEILEVNLATEPEDSIHWTIGTDTYIKQTSITDSFTAGTYNVRLAVSNANRCQIILDSFILVHPTPTANFSYSPDEIFISNPEVFFNDLSSGNVIGWDWDFGDNNFSADENPIHTYGSGGEYDVILFVETDEGCIDSTSQKVIIKDELRVFIPNAISIQNDGLNEAFRVVGIGYTNIKIQIFNRWGERIYQSDNFTEWDGTYRGEKVQMGAYIYIMTITDNRGMKHHMDGEIQVIR